MTQEASPARSPKLLDQVRDRIRVKHYSLRTEEVYVDWIKRYIHAPWQAAPEGAWGLRRGGLFDPFGGAWPGGCEHAESGQIGAALPVSGGARRGVAMARQRDQARAPTRFPVVRIRAEVQSLLGRLSGTHWLIASLLYGAGLRLMEGLRLRVKDVELLGHADVKTTMIYTHVLNRGGRSVVSPLDLAQR